MKRLPLLSLFLLATIAAKAYSFSAIAPTGQTLYYNIVNGEAQTTYPDNYWHSGYTMPTDTLKIPDSVTYHGITYRVTSIGAYSFYNCIGLTQVTIPNTITSIGDYAFSGCSGLTSLTIPNTVDSIGNYAFSGCSGMTSVSISNSISFISEGVFRQCSGLISVTIPESVISIGYGAFALCSNLISVFIPNSVITIGASAFTSTALTSLDIPNSVDTIREDAFYCCYSLPNVIVPASVSVIGYAAFGYVGHIEYHGAATGAPWGALSMNGVTDSDFVFSNTTKDTLIAYIGGGGNVVIPSSVVAINEWTFSNCQRLTSVSIPNTVNSIGSWAFNNCSGLTILRIPNSVTFIGVRAFGECNNLASISVEGGNPIYDSRDSCNAIIETTNNTLILGCKNTTIPNNISRVGSFAFSGCVGLTDITIPSSVNRICYNAFNGCCGLTSVNIPNSVTFIESSAFFDCINLTSVTLSESLGSISSETFRNCINLANITIPDSVTVIGSYAFFNCRRLFSVSIPNSVVFIGASAFANCSGLIAINIPDFVRNIDDGVFSGCSNLTSISIPELVVSIGNNAFSGCSSLSSVFIGGSVTSIGSNAFNTFNNSLDSVFLLPRIPPLIQNDAFGHGYDFKIFYVPCGTTNDYQDAWEGGYQYDFSEEWTPYSITVGVDNSQMGTVSTVLTFCEVTISADANQGYHFSQWNDGDTNNPRTCILTQDTLFTAIFAADTHTGTQGINVVTNKDETMIISKYDRILIDGLRGQDVSIYTIDGRMVATLPKVTEHVVVPVTTSGVYFVKIGTYPARKVVVIH